MWRLQKATLVTLALFLHFCAGVELCCVMPFRCTSIIQGRKYESKTTLQTYSLTIHGHGVVELRIMLLFIFGIVPLNVCGIIQLQDTRCYNSPHLVCCASYVHRSCRLIKIFTRFHIICQILLSSEKGSTS